MRPIVVATCLSIAMLASAGFASRGLKTEASETECLSIFGSEQYVLVTEGCNSPADFCAAGTFNGNHGFKGNSFYSAIGFARIPNDPLDDPKEPPVRQVVPGMLTYTTDDGAITINDVSVFDVERGTFSGVGRIVEGTGRFAGATGDIFTAGRVLPDGSFINEFKGEICLPR